MRGDDLFAFAAAHSIEVITIEELAKSYGEITFNHLNEIRWAKLPRAEREWQMGIYRNNFGIEHAVLKFGTNTGNSPLIRMLTNL